MQAQNLSDQIATPSPKPARNPDGSSPHAGRRGWMAGISDTVARLVGNRRKVPAKSDHDVEISVNLDESFGKIDPKD